MNFTDSGYTYFIQRSQQIVSVSAVVNQRPIRYTNDYVGIAFFIEVDQRR